MDALASGTRTAVTFVFNVAFPEGLMRLSRPRVSCETTKSFAEKLDQLQQLLNAVFNRLTEIISRKRGTIYGTWAIS